MRVFVSEWSACVPDAPPSLRREGWAMLWSVLHDFQKSRQVETITLLHASFPHVPPGKVLRFVGSAEERELFCDAASGADATLVIAPETAGILDQRCAWVESVGGRLLGPSAAARRVTTSKRLLAALWEERGVPTPPVLAWSDQRPRGLEFPIVLKPDDGAGSQATFLVGNNEELGAAWLQGGLECPQSRFLAQRFVPGQAASIAFLVGPRACIPLVPAAQQLSADNRLRFLGGSLPLPSPLDKRAAALGRRAVQAVDGLRGFVGVDLVLGDAADGSRDYAIEINPRLTTSYIGLRMLTSDNLAMAMVRVALGDSPGPLRWRHEVIRFHADGSLETWPTLR
jgi:predicted ATP-grasp superfamily ATP-dependent carboligase